MEKVHFFFRNAESRPVSATIDVPMYENQDDSIGTILSVLNDFAEAEALPPSRVIHLRCAMLALLREEDEIFASRDFVPQPLHSQRNVVKKLGGSAAAMASSAGFQQAYCRAVSNKVHLKTLAHMESMYAAAVQDLWLAQESTVARQNAWVSETLHQKNKKKDPTMEINQHLQNSAVLVEQYRCEIQHTKREQREGFREFIMEQDAETKGLNNDDDDDDDDDDDEGGDEEQGHGMNDAMNHVRTGGMTSKKSYEGMVQQGLPALFSLSSSGSATNNDHRNHGKKHNNTNNTNMNSNSSNNHHHHKHNHLSSHTTRRLLRFVTCFGQQRKSTIEIELLSPSALLQSSFSSSSSSSSSAGASIMSMFFYSNDPDMGLLQRMNNAQQICANDNALHAILLPMNKYGAMDKAFIQLCQRSTEFCFHSVETQYEKGEVEMRRRNNKKQKQKNNTQEGGKDEKFLEHGDTIMTKHTNVCGLHLAFHVARDITTTTLQKNATTTTPNVIQNYAEENGKEEDLHTTHQEPHQPEQQDQQEQHQQQLAPPSPNMNFRKILSTSIKNIIKLAALSGASVLYIPFDLYSPIEAGFGTRDFVTLVRDTRTAIMELISSQRQQVFKHELKCIRFVKSHKKSNDEALTLSLISILKEQFASDIYHEDA